MEVKCPYCGKPALFSPQNPYRPFCSERCKMIDLGQWAEEKYAVPAQSVSEDELEELERLLEEKLNSDQSKPES